MNEPLVSVVIPVYNGANTIKRTLQSVSAQTHLNLEIIVVDDGSVDDTPAIVRSHCIADRRVGLLHQANGGVARARNTGLRHARGEFVAFIDADDLWHPTRVAKHVTVMRAGGDKVAVVYSPCRWIDEHDNVIGSSCAYGCSGSVLLRLIYSNFVGNGSALLLRRPAALEAGGFDPGLRDNGIEGCEDYLLQLKLAQRYEFGLMPEYLVGYRVYSPRMSSDGARMQASKQHVLESIRRARPDLPDAPFELLKLKSTPARPATFKPVAPIARNTALSRHCCVRAGSRRRSLTSGRRSSVHRTRRGVQRAVDRSCISTLPKLRPAGRATMNLRCVILKTWKRRLAADRSACLGNCHGRRSDKPVSL